MFYVTYPYVPQPILITAPRCIQGMWSRLQVQCFRRSACIKNFRGELEGVERLRSQAVGRELRRLVDDIVAIACRMPDEVERMAEVRAIDLGHQDLYVCEANVSTTMVL